MSKLLYINLSQSDSKTWLTNQGTNANWDSSSNPYYRSIVFTKDGYIITHGKTFNGNNSNTTYKINLNGTDVGGGSTLLATFYAPTSSGTSGQILQSAGSNSAPSWLSLSTDLSGTVTDTNVPSALAVQNYINNRVTSLFSWQGAATVTSGTLTIPTSPKVGYAYRIPSATTLLAANSLSGSNETLEAGDIIICVNETGPKFTAIQTNWTTSAGTSTLDWNSEVTLGTVGGLAIKAKLPADPVTRLSYTATVTSSTAGYYTIGTLKKDSSDWATLYGIDTTHNFYVGASGAKSDAAVSSGTNVYLTTKLSTAGSSANGTNILGFALGTGINISASNAKLITIALKKATTSAIGGIVISNALSTAVTLTSGDGATANRYYGVQVDKDGKAFVNIPWVNTWRNVNAYLLSNNTATEILSTSVGTADLAFSSDFLWNGDTSDGTLHLGWAEVDAQGAITYAV